MWILWLIVGIIFSTAEILYSGFFLIWFAIGAFFTMIFAFFAPNNVLLQSIIFLLVSIILLLTLTKRVAQLFSSTSLPMNIDILIGKKGIVTEAIGKDNFETGLVKLDGEIWTAVSKDGVPIQKGATVQVHEVKGVRLFVSETENQGGI